MLARGFAVLFSTVVLAACAQTTGEVCEVDGDCESGLTCCKDTSSSRGTCDRADRCADIISRDAGPIPVDSGIDAQVVGPGLGQVCRGAEPFCMSPLVCFRGICVLPEGTDAGGELDSGAESDSGVDAGTDSGAAEDAGEDAGLDGGA